MEIPTVTVALPIYNAESFLEDCFQSIIAQKLCDETKSKTCATSDNGDSLTNEVCKPHNNASFKVEVSVYDDGSNDSSPEIIERWKKRFEDTPNFSFVHSINEEKSPRGVGYARNKTILQSHGEYICFCDSDDIMDPRRILSQYKLCAQNLHAIIGSKFRRIPEDSTKNFTKWSNSLTQDQLQTQIYLSFGPSIVMPTWFCHRSVYDSVVGGFDESGKGTPEDLIFFYKHLDRGGTVIRADDELVVYRYHPNATTFSVTDEVIWSIRLNRLESKVLSTWTKFSIWNAGKLGRRLYRSLSKSNRDKVGCFCDVDIKKISQKWYHPYPIQTKVSIVHVKDAPPPFIICVKTELTLDANGDFRVLLDSLNLDEGKDYFFFN